MLVMNQGQIDTGLFSFFAITVIMQLFFYNMWYLKLECFFSFKNLKYKQNQSVLYSESLISSKQNLIAIEFSFNFCTSHFKDFIKQQV